MDHRRGGADYAYLRLSVVPHYRVCSDFSDLGRTSISLPSRLSPSVHSLALYKLRVK